jgi:hypothetical protein
LKLHPWGAGFIHHRQIFSSFRSVQPAGSRQDFHSWLFSLFLGFRKISLAIYSTRDLLFAHVLNEQAAILEVGVSEEAWSSTVWTFGAMYKACPNHPKQQFGINSSSTSWGDLMREGYCELLLLLHWVVEFNRVRSPNHRESETDRDTERRESLVEGAGSYGATTSSLLVIRDCICG